MTIAPIQGKQQSWFSDWGNLLLIGAVLYSVLFVAWLLAGWGDEQTYNVVAELGFFPLILVGVIFAARMALSSSVDTRYRRAWSVIGIGFLLWLVADALWASSMITHGDVLAPSIANVAYTGSWVFIIAGILLFPTSRLSRAELTRYAIDFAIILFSFTVLVAYFLIGPELIGSAVDPSLNTYVLLAYPVTNTLMILAVASLLIRRPEAGTMSVILLLGIGLIIYAVADLQWAYLEVRGLEAHIGLLYSIWVIGQLLVCIAPQRHYAVLRQGVTTRFPEEHLELLRKATPYVATGFGAMVILTAAVPELVNRFGPIVILLAVLLGLIVARQVLTIGENTRLRVEQVRHEAEDRIRALVEYSSDMITVVDRELVIQFQSPASQRLLGQDPETFYGTELLTWAQVDDREQLRQFITGIINDGCDHETFEWRMEGSDGRVVHLETVLSNELENPGVNGLVLNSRNITERKQLEDELTFQAYHDALTKLPNRASFLNTLVRAIGNIEPGNGVGLIFLDIDHFKLINDTLGHDAGDELLVRVGERLRGCLRPGDTLARLAGDEFTILLPGVRSEHETRKVANRVLRSTDAPVRLGEGTTSVSLSLGVAFTDSPKTDPSALLRHADSAMYAAKRKGRGRVEMFEPWMDVELSVSAHEDRRSTAVNPFE